MIKPEFWSDMRTGRLSDTAKVIFIAMLNIADDEGKLIGDPEYLLSTIYPYSNCQKRSFVKALDELDSALCIIKYSIKKFNYIIIPNFNKHQRIDKPQPSKIPDPDWSSETIRNYFYNYQDGICPDCKREMILESRGQNTPYPYDSNNNSVNEGDENGNNSRVLSIDHIFPQSKGGSHNISNLRAICITCNKRKKNKVSEGGFEEHSESILGTVAAEKKRSKREVKEKEKEKEKGKEDTPLPSLEKILFAWNDFAKANSLPQIVSLSDKRRKAIRVRLKEESFSLPLILQEISRSKFLLGNNERGWKVDFDFVFCSANNYLKIIEGKYRTNGTNINARRKGDLDIDKYQREFATEKKQEEETNS